MCSNMKRDFLLLTFFISTNLNNSKVDIDMISVSQWENTLLYNEIVEQVETFINETVV